MPVRFGMKPIGPLGRGGGGRNSLISESLGLIPGLVGQRVDGFDPASLALFAAMTTQPSDAVKAQYDAAIKMAKSDGAWNVLDLWYGFTAHDEQASRLNIKNPAVFTLNPAAGGGGTYTFTSGTGFQWDGVAGYGATGFVPSTAGGNYTLNAATAAVVSGSDALISATPQDGFGSGTTLRFASRISSATAGGSARINGSTTASLGNLFSAIGLCGATRVSSSEVRTYYRGARAFTNTGNASTALPSVEVRLAQHSTQFTPRPFRGMLIGGALSDDQWVTMDLATKMLLPGYGPIFVLPAMGQSNNVGRATVDPLVDLEDPLVWQMVLRTALRDGAAAEANGKTISENAVIAASQESPVSTLSTAYVMAKRIAAVTGQRVLIVPSAVGGTGLVTPSAAYGNVAPWAVGNPLYTAAVADTLAALAWAKRFHPGSSLWGASWIQGETDVDAAVSQATYYAALESFITSFRTAMGVADLRFVIGGMMPEFISTRGAAGAAIDAAHQAAATNLSRVSYTPGPSGFALDVYHYNAAGTRSIGLSMANAGLAL